MENQQNRINALFEALTNTYPSNQHALQQSLLETLQTIKGYYNSEKTLIDVCSKIKVVVQSHYPDVTIPANTEFGNLWAIEMIFSFFQYADMVAFEEEATHFIRIFKDLLTEWGQMIACQRAMARLADLGYPKNFITIRRVVDAEFKNVFKFYKNRWWLFFCYNNHRLDEVMVEYINAHVIDKIKLIATGANLSWDAFISHITQFTPTIIKDVKNKNGERIEAAYTLVMMKFACSDVPIPVFIGYDDIGDEID